MCDSRHGPWADLDVCQEEGGQVHRPLAASTDIDLQAFERLVRRLARPEAVALGVEMRVPNSGLAQPPDQVVARFARTTYPYSLGDCGMGQQNMNPCIKSPKTTYPTLQKFHLASPPDYRLQNAIRFRVQRPCIAWPLLAPGLQY